MDLSKNKLFRKVLFRMPENLPKARKRQFVQKHARLAIHALSKFPMNARMAFQSTGICFTGGVKEEGLEFVLTGVQNSIGVGPSSPGRTFRPHFKWTLAIESGKLPILGHLGLMVHVYRFQHESPITRFMCLGLKRIGPLLLVCLDSSGGAYAGLT